MPTETMSIAKREQELSVYLDKQPYMTELDGIKLKIAKNVFPSDFGLTSSFFGHFMLQQRAGIHGLDMGCGSGYFAFVLKKLGCQTVIGVDFNPDAVACAQENLNFNPELSPIQFIHSDLFNQVPPQTFDLIVFNFNYYPSNGVFGLNADGGQAILKRFFSQVRAYSQPDTRIYIPYSAFVGEEHDPKLICRSYGFNVETVATTLNHNGEHCIYELTAA